MFLFPKKSFLFSQKFPCFLTIVSSSHPLIATSDSKSNIPDTDFLFYISNFPAHKFIPKWAIILLGGGHFAGAIFEGPTAVAHKTFHCYTVRAKQGGSQSAADNKSGTSHPKSAGASLRRYNQVHQIDQINCRKLLLN